MYTKIITAHKEVIRLDLNQKAKKWYKEVINSCSFGTYSSVGSLIADNTIDGQKEIINEKLGT